jgi:hypothetical protein
MRALLGTIAFSCLASTATLERGSLPDARLTPGDTLAVTNVDICTPGYTKLVRAVPAAVKRQVYAGYHQRQRKGVCCEVDHLIALELGGSNRVTNLWPEPYDITWNAHVKDRLENRLHELVCTGQLDLATAQKAIATDWISLDTRYRYWPRLCHRLAAAGEPMLRRAKTATYTRTKFRADRRRLGERPAITDPQVP